MKGRAALRKIAWGSVLPLAILAIWHAASQRSALVPSLGEVADVLAHPFREPLTLDAIPLGRSAVISLIRIAVGFGLAVLTGIPVGIWAGRSRRFHEAVTPALSASMVISPVAWLPVTILVFGLASPATWMFGDDAWKYTLLDQLRFAIVAVIGMGAFFPIALNTASGVRGVRDAHIEAVRVFGASRTQVLFKVVLPAAAPAILTGLRVGGGIAWRVMVAAEVFPGTRGGLGYMIATAHSQAAYEYAFAAIVLIGGIGLALDGLLRAISRPVIHWQPKER
ncbi:MAG: ABC transporter permease [Kiritimatiellae bacterium]|nr:ABC transporter permease [Kiritimatiellia bacterium]